jgi:serine/threonine protein kinase
MLYEMVCGRRPFVMPEGRDPRAKKYFFQNAHQEDVPPAPVTLRRDCPEDLDGLILRCLEKGPEKRYSSFKEIEAEVAR